MPFDQAHEQEKKIVKSADGAVGLTENPPTFRYADYLVIDLLINLDVYERR